MKKYILPMLGISAVLGIIFFFNSKQVSANPSQILDGVQTATATSSPVFLSTTTYNQGTTTLGFDTQADGGQGVDSAFLEIQLTATSTATVLRVEYEYANNTLVNGTPFDCSAQPVATTTGGPTCDWYADNTIASSTIQVSPQDISVNQFLTWKFASSTIGGIPVTTQRATKIVPLRTPTRYIRAVFSVSGGNGAVWAKFVPKREQR